jgi:hypothetical protein
MMPFCQCFARRVKRPISYAHLRNLHFTPAEAAAVSSVRTELLFLVEIAQVRRQFDEVTSRPPELADSLLLFGVIVKIWSTMGKQALGLFVKRSPFARAILIASCRSSIALGRRIESEISAIASSSLQAA